MNLLCLQRTILQRLPLTQDPKMYISFFINAPFLPCCSRIQAPLRRGVAMQWYLRFGVGVVRTFRTSATRCRNQAFRPGLKKVEDQAKAARIRSSELRKLMSLARPERKTIIVGIGLLFISSGVTLSVPFLMGRLIDLVFKGEADDSGERRKLSKDELLAKMLNFSYIMVAIFIAGAAANFGRIYLLNSAGERVVNRLRTTVFSNVLRQEVAFFNTTKTGEVVNRLSNDTSVIGYTVTMNISDGLRSVCAAAGSISMMFYVSPSLALVGLGIVPPISICAMLYGRYVKRLTEKVNDALAEATQVAEERISNIRTIRAFATENNEDELYKKKIANVLQLAYTNAKASGAFYGFTGLSGNLSLLAVLFYGGSLIAEQHITIGELSSFMIYVIYVGVSVAGMGSFYTELMRGLGASTRLWELADRSPLIPLTGGIQLQQLHGDIEFRNVTFSYGERSGSAPVLNDFSLKVPAGSVTALVGQSGAGKSTVGALLLRFYDPEHGAVYFDGHDLRELDSNWVKSLCGVVSQEPVLFSGSIRDNITYGASQLNISDTEIYEATKKANAYNFIKTFPNELDTELGEKGLNLSGGQRQRIAIARALIKNPRILLLDEATSALDAESEYLVKKALDNLIHSGKRTVIMIAHRLSTVKYADQIAVMDGGKIVEAGTYNQLMAIEGGLFRRLVERQTIKDEEELKEESDVVDESFNDEDFVRDEDSNDSSDNQITQNR